MLQPAEYNALEAEAIKGMDPAIVAAFQPVQFIRSGFPTRIESLSELPKFADHLVEPETALYFQDGSRFPMSGWVNGFTQREFELVQKLRGDVVRGTAALGRGVRPMLMPLIHVAALRVMDKLTDLDRYDAYNVLEIGPGTGYLGPLANMCGIGYHPMDITQSYVLWQEALKGFGSIGNGTGRIWWWDYVAGRVPNADIVYSNANLSEMTPEALDIVIMKAELAMLNSLLGAFVYFHLGDPHHSSARQVEDALTRHGFVRRQSEPVHIWQIEGCRPLKQAIKLDPIGEGLLYWTAREMAWCLPGEEPLDFDAKRVFGG